MRAAEKRFDRFVRIVFEDNGTGMTPETMTQIFNPFFTTKSVGEGTGLGLPICRNIVERHNGFIGVSSHPGKGTTFYIYLPVLRST